MKYYFYISDSKVEMLYQQIPTKFKDSVFSELSINMGIVKASLKDRAIEECQIGKLETVEQFILKHEATGNLSEPGTYIHESQLPMKIHNITMREKGGVVFAAERDGTLLVLVGSGKHIIGMEAENSVATTFSLPWTIFSTIEAIRDGYQHNGPFDDSVSAEKLTNYAPVFTRRENLPEKECQFLARIFYREQTVHGTVLLGSPLYVALA